MAVIVELIRKDLRKSLASPAGLLVALAIPMALAGTMALAFGSLSGSPATPKLEIVIVDEDGAALATFLAGSSQSGEAAKYLLTARAETREAGLDLMREAGHHALLVIPKGFTEKVLAGAPVTLDLVKNPSRRILPIVAQQGLEVVSLYGSVGARMIPKGGGEKVQRLIKGEGWDDTIGIAALLTDTYLRVTRSESLLFPPIIKVDKVKASASEKEGDSGAFNFLEWMYPGMIVMALLFVGLNQMKDLLIEQDEGTMRRLLSGPVTATQILAARITSSALAVAGALALLLATGSLAFGLRWGSPLPLLASCIALVFAVTGFAALLYSIARTQNQGDALGGICVILMSLLGGTLVPGQVLPGFVQGAARFTINYWGNETFRALAGGGGWSELSVHLPVLAAMAAAFTLSGAALMKMRHMRGAV